jgi:site-specific recombinase XerD
VEACYREKWEAHTLDFLQNSGSGIGWLASAKFGPAPTPSTPFLLRLRLGLELSDTKHKLPTNYYRLNLSCDRMSDPHMLRHSTGYKLANQGEDTRSLAHYLGHRNLQSTARYTALAPDRFAKFWKD